MAENSESEKSSLNQSRQSISAHSRRCSCPKYRRIGSKGAALVVAWSHLVYISCTSFLFSSFAQLQVVTKSVSTASIIGSGMFVLSLGPFVGLVASAYYGRYRTLYASFWFMWSGIFGIAFLLVTNNLLLETYQPWVFSGVVIAEVVYFIGFTAFTVNSVPFGLDQMPDGSGEQITAFIHWYVWSVLVGFVTASLLSTIQDCTHLPDIGIFQPFFSAVLLTLVLCSTFLLHGWLTIEPNGPNPLKTVFRVLKFAAKHKIPIRRSAFTYCENKKPSRIDLAKSKYGGPFTNEQVEDVKTCLRMVLVIASLIATACPISALLFSWSSSLPAMFKYSYFSCNEDITQICLLSGSCVVLSLPVFDIIIQPLIRKFIPSTLKRVGLAHILMVCPTVILLAVSTVWYAANTSSGCIFTSSDLPSLSFDHKWVEVPILLVYYGSFIVLLTAILEFVCAQAPYDLRGLLVGLVHSAVLSSLLLGIVIDVSNEYIGSSDSSCGVWFYLFTTITTILGCILWCAVAKWYKKRERDEPEMCRIFAENYYDH